MVLKKEGSSEVPKTFTYDYVYGIESTQQQVYDECAFSLVESVLEGYNGIAIIFKVSRNYICLWTNWLWQNSYNDGEHGGI